MFPPILTKILVALFKYLPVVWPIIESIKEHGFKKGIKKFFSKPKETDDLKSVLIHLSTLLEDVDGEDSALFKSFLNKIVDGGDLTPFAKAVREALADGEITKKEIALIALAYQLEIGSVAKEDISSNGQIAELLGYKTSTAALTQISKVRNKLAGKTDQ